MDDEAQNLSFPRHSEGWRADVPITEKIVWQAVNEAPACRHHQARISSFASTLLATHMLEAGAACAPSRSARTLQARPHTVYLHLSSALCRRFPVRWKPSRCPALTR